MAALAGVGLRAQDRRAVREPVVPPVCTTVPAKLASADGGLRAADEASLDTARVQAALDGCAAGHAVRLAVAGGDNAILAGPLRVPAGVTLLVDRGVTLFASRDPALYAWHPGSCGVVNHEPPGCKPLIGVQVAPHAAVMGEGTIDGRGGATLLHGEVTWWQLAEQARAGGRQQVPRLVVADGSDDFTLYGITLRNAPNFHVTFSNGRGFTVWGVHIETPRTARNTDGIDPGGSATDITIAHSMISTGDDHVAIKGSGTGVHYMSVLDNRFGTGHGMSIGSETFGGVSDVLVRGLAIDGADNGLRIKSNVHRGGLVDRVLYEKVCVRGTRNPITFDTRYDNPGPQTNLIPTFRGVVVRDVHVLGGGAITVDGVDAQHRTEVQFDRVVLDDPSAYKFFAKDAVVGYGPGAVNFRLTGEHVSTSVEKGDGPGHTATTAASTDPCADAAGGPA